MAVTYSTTAKTGRMQAVADLIAGKTIASTGSASQGRLVIGTSALAGQAEPNAAILASIPLSATPGTVSNGVLTLSVPVTGTAANTGTAAKAEIRNSSGTVIVSGLTVGTSGADITVMNTAITAGQTVQVTSGSITHAT